jgi:hypothetical protein
VYDYDPYDEFDEQEERYWTPRRVVFLLITLLIIIAFLAWTLRPLLDAALLPPPPPRPTPIPPSLL